MNHFEAFCQATPKNENGYVPDLLDMGSDAIRDQAVVAYLRDIKNYHAADDFHFFGDDMKGEYYRALEIVMQDEVDKFNQKIDDAKEAAKEDHPYAIDSEYKYQHFNQAMFDAGMKPSDF
jgi:hypothetical protein